MKMLEDISGGDLFKEIVAFKKEKKITDFSLMEIIILYCEEEEIDIVEAGEILKKDKSFRETLKEDLKLHHEAVFDDDHKYKSNAEWII